MLRTSGSSSILGDSPQMQRALSLARRVAATDLPVLIVGATGTGKELLAQQIHVLSGRRGDLVDLNCAAFPEQMIDALLFGHRRGAFTGAMEDARGLIEAAHEGTLFLDELLDMPAEVQVKLLRAVDNGEIRRVGETHKRRSRFRIIAAVQASIGSRLRDGLFRRDLIERLAGVVIPLAPLVERGHDLLLLADHFAKAEGRCLAPECGAVLRAHSWPGNIRELRLAIERTAILSDAITISGEALSESIAMGAAALTGREDAKNTTLANPRDRLLAICAAHHWNAARIAHALNLGRTTLFKHFRAMGISLRKQRSAPG